MPEKLKAAFDLSLGQRGALLTLGSRGASASFDLVAMSQLFVVGMIEVSNASRRVVLTPRGDIAYEYLAARPMSNLAGIESQRGRRQEW